MSFCWLFCLHSGDSGAAPVAPLPQMNENWSLFAKQNSYKKQAHIQKDKLTQKTSLSPKLRFDQTPEDLVFVFQPAQWAIATVVKSAVTVKCNRAKGIHDDGKEQ